MPHSSGTSLFPYHFHPPPSLLVTVQVNGKSILLYRGTDKSLARPGRKQARKHVRDARDFNNIETRAVIKFFFLQGKAPKEIHAILTETLACFLPGRAKDLSAPLYILESTASNSGPETAYSEVLS